MLLNVSIRCSQSLPLRACPKPPTLYVRNSASFLAAFKVGSAMKCGTMVGPDKAKLHDCQVFEAQNSGSHYMNSGSLLAINSVSVVAKEQANRELEQ